MKPVSKGASTKFLLFGFHFPEKIQDVKKNRK